MKAESKDIIGMSFDGPQEECCVRQDSSLPNSIGNVNPGWKKVLVLQAFFSACAKMCVRELRKTETANVSVFYLSFCSTIGALIGTIGPKIFGVENSIRTPHGTEWLLLLGVGKSHLLFLFWKLWDHFNTILSDISDV